MIINKKNTDHQHFYRPHCIDTNALHPNIKLAGLDASQWWTEIKTKTYHIIYHNATWRHQTEFKNFNLDEIFKNFENEIFQSERRNKMEKKDVEKKLQQSSSASMGLSCSSNHDIGLIRIWNSATYNLFWWANTVCALHTCCTMVEKKVIQYFFFMKLDLHLQCTVLVSPFTLSQRAAS